MLKMDSAAPHAEAITKLDWNYGTHITADTIAREINGYDLTTGKLMESFGVLKGDGTTSSGNWLYCNMYTEQEGNKAKRRNTVDSHPNQIGLYSGWAWCWPLNRRIIYNRASVDLDGVPWDKEHPVILNYNPETKWRLAADKPGQRRGEISSFHNEA